MDNDKKKTTLYFSTSITLFILLGARGSGWVQITNRDWGPSPTFLVTKECQEKIG